MRSNHHTLPQSKGHVLSRAGLHMMAVTMGAALIQKPRSLAKSFGFSNGTMKRNGPKECARRVRQMQGVNPHILPDQVRHGS